MMLVRRVGWLLLKCAFATGVAASVAGGSFAGNVTLGMYLSQRQEPALGQNLTWLDGVYYGLLTASIDLSLDGKLPLFCPPEKMTVTTPQIVDIVDRNIARNRGRLHSDWPMGTILLGALKEVFPCH